MPIRPELRHLYGAEHRRFRLKLIEEAGGEICGSCGIELAQGINLAHEDHDPTNPEKATLKCPACHAAFDAKHRIAIQRRTRAKITGQAWLLPELEWAPFADFEIPGWVADRLRQLRLDFELCQPNPNPTPPQPPKKDAVSSSTDSRPRLGKRSIYWSSRASQTWWKW
jgi:hypothetical protein